MSSAHLNTTGDSNLPHHRSDMQQQAIGKLASRKVVPIKGSSYNNVRFGVTILKTIAAVGAVFVIIGVVVATHGVLAGPGLQALQWIGGVALGGSAVLLLGFSSIGGLEETQSLERHFKRGVTAFQKREALGYPKGDQKEEKAPTNLEEMHKILQVAEAYNRAVEEAAGGAEHGESFRVAVKLLDKGSVEQQAKPSVGHRYIRSSVLSNHAQDITYQNAITEGTPQGTALRKALNVDGAGKALLKNIEAFRARPQLAYDLMNKHVARLESQTDMIIEKEIAAVEESHDPKKSERLSFLKAVKYDRFNPNGKSYLETFETAIADISNFNSTHS